MQYLALAVDYDETTAHDGRVDSPTRDALRRVTASGRRLLLVTGRELDDLFAIFPHYHVFDRIVAENDHAFLRHCGLGVAVANALPALKAMADLVTTNSRGAGVTEVIDRLLADDLAGVKRQPAHHDRVKHTTPEM